MEKIAKFWYSLNFEKKETKPRKLLDEQPSGNKGQSNKKNGNLVWILICEAHKINE